MKIFHTADWHLGKLVQGFYMTEDQHYILQQFLTAIDEEQPDVVIIAGDLYDRSMPPIEAVNLLNDTLAEIVLKRKIPVLAIAGNHDSAGRLSFGSQLMRDSGLFIKGQYSKTDTPVVLTDVFGDVHFHLVPYVEPAQIRTIFEDETIRTHQDAMEAVVNHLTENLDSTKRHVLIGHAFVTKYGEEEANTSDSERPLSIGGSDCVNAALFEPFHYTALGHLHKAHFVLNETIRYAGSPLKYSLSEHLHEKGFLIVELDEEGHVTVQKRKLHPRRDLRVVEGLMSDLLQLPPSDDYVFVRLTDTIPVQSPMERIRTVFPYAMHLERKTAYQATNQAVQAVEQEKIEDIDLFRSFYETVVGQLPNEQAEHLFTDMLQELLDEERESIQ
ncbi:exonuclease SbcCD subunit D [Lysinibacillus piscis]|uniref:Nuclease SbcCD subunit D n=1 Tax=Lysinibacillus piscis TaxID=2518931 RepID=A0ABQ5NQE7_9BACI|nr:exonuclease SbcCD subunit D [Lysinibacillus sp. KH24]GLC90336.1 nuclease SbcCD subunit D [Lysinibacillus sp. KH24]